MWKGRVSGQTGLEAREVSMVGLGGVVDNWMKGRLYGMAFVWLFWNYFTGWNVDLLLFSR